MSDYENGKHYVYDAALQTFHLADPELDALIELQMEADGCAIKRWQEAHPDRPGVWPDRTDMVTWLMEQHDLLDRMLTQSQELAARYGDEIERLLGEVAKLSDPVAVHLNMLRGTIAKPSIEQILHLYPALDGLRATLRDVVDATRPKQGGAQEAIHKSAVAALEAL